MNSGPQVVEKPAEAKKEQEDNNLDRTESEEREEIGEGSRLKAPGTELFSCCWIASFWPSGMSVIPGLVHYSTIMIAHEMCSNLASCSDCNLCWGSADCPAIPSSLWVVARMGCHVCFGYHSYCLD